MGFLEGVLVAEAFCRQDSSMRAALVLSGFGAECLLRFGSEDLKKNYLPGVAEGEMLCGGELAAGTLDSGLEAHAVNAVRQNGHLLVSGKTLNAVNAMTADILVVLCNSGPDAASPEPILWSETWQTSKL